MTLPPDLCYRIFDGKDTHLGIFMNVLEERLVLLEKEALNAWHKMVDGGETNGATSHAGIFNALGLVSEDKGICGRHKKPANPEGITEAEVSLLNYFAFRNRLPLAGHLELTQRCNLRCRHCYCVDHGKGDTLSTRAWCGIIDDLASNGVMFLVLTGGELFVREDIVDILEKLHESRFVLRINTNGTFIDEEMVHTLSRFGNIFRIHVSVYGGAAATHDHVTRAPGSFAKTVRALEMLKEAGFRLRINCSVMNANINDYQEVYTAIGKPLGIPVHFDPSIFPMDDDSGRNRGEQLSSKDLARVRRYKQNIDGAADKETQGKHQLCRAASAFFSVTSKGDIYPCLKMKRIYDQPLGNVIDENFKTIWQSASVTTIRESLERTLTQCDLCDVII